MKSKKLLLKAVRLVSTTTLKKALENQRLLKSTIGIIEDEIKRRGS